MTWNSLAAVLALSSVVTTGVSVSLSAYLLRGSPQNINTQTVTVQDPRDEIRREIAQQAYEDLKNERSVRRSDANGGKLAGEPVGASR